MKIPAWQCGYLKRKLTPYKVFCQNGGRYQAVIYCASLDGIDFSVLDPSPDSGRFDTIPPVGEPNGDSTLNQKRFPLVIDYHPALSDTAGIQRKYHPLLYCSCIEDCCSRITNCPISFLELNVLRISEINMSELVAMQIRLCTRTLTPQYNDIIVDSVAVVRF